MNKKRLSLSGRYKRFFLSERTALIAAFMSVLILPVIYFFGTRSGGLELPGVYDLMLRLLLIVTLYYSLRKHKLFLMQAATVGLLFCMLCAQSQYALGNLASRASETYITMGLQGFVFLAGERMILFIQSFVCQPFHYPCRQAAGSDPGFRQPGLHSLPAGPGDYPADHRACPEL